MQLEKWRETQRGRSRCVPRIFPLAEARRATLPACTERFVVLRWSREESELPLPSRQRALFCSNKCARNQLDVTKRFCYADNDLESDWIADCDQLPRRDYGMFGRNEVTVSRTAAILHCPKSFSCDLLPGIRSRRRAERESSFRIAFAVLAQPLVKLCRRSGFGEDR